MIFIGVKKNYMWMGEHTLAYYQLFSVISLKIPLQKLIHLNMHRNFLPLGSMQ